MEPLQEPVPCLWKRSTVCGYSTNKDGGIAVRSVHGLRVNVKSHIDGMYTLQCHVQQGYGVSGLCYLPASPDKKEHVDRKTP